jgi:hypothetical protein
VAGSRFRAPATSQQERINEMPKKKDSNSQDKASRTPDAVPADPVLAVFNALAEEFWPDALRAAFTSNSRLERCDRRSCKLAGSCQMTYTRGKPLDCGGGEPEAALMKAAFGVVVGCVMIRAILPAIAIAVLPDIARAVLPDIAKDG